MAIDVWKGTGNWITNASTDWSTGSPPSSSQDAEIASGDATLNGTGAADTLTILDGATLTTTGAASLTLAGQLDQLGTMEIDTNNADGGAKVSIAGALVNHNNLTIGNSGLDASTTVTAKSLANSGSITLWGDEKLGTTNQSTLDIAAAAPTLLTGTINLHGDSLLEFGSGGIAGLAAGSELQIDGQQARVSIGAGTTNSALSGLHLNEGTLDLEGNWSTGPGGTSVTTTTYLDNTHDLDIDVYNGDGASSLSIGGELTNTGSVTVGNSSLSASSTLTATQIGNLGTITLWGNEKLGTTDQATFDITGSFSGVITGGYYLHGDSLLEVANGVTTIVSGAELQLDGEQSRVSIGSGTTNSGLATLTSIIGTFDMEGDWTTGPGGSSVTTSGALTNTGTLELDVYNADGASSLTIGGALVNTGSVTIGDSNLSASTTVKAAGLTNSGSIVLWGNEKLGTADQSTLDITSASPATLTGKVYLHGDALLEFASGGIDSIGYGAELQLDGEQSRVSIGSGTTNSALATLTSIVGTFDMEGDWSTGPGGSSVTTSGALTNTGTLQLDVYNADGASSLTIGGALVNTGSVTIGNSNLSASTTVEAAGLTNSGSIVLWGNETLKTTDQSTLDITSAAPTTLTGDVDLHGDALLEFASGGIDSIGYGASLQLDGEQSRVSIGSGTTNSGLATLTSIIGTFDMEGNWSTGPGGSSVTTSGALTNTGTLELDVYNADGASSLTIGGALVNTASVTIGNSNLSASTTVTAAGLTNTGSIVLWGNEKLGTTDQSTLDITSAAPTTLTGDVYLHGDALLEFASGGIDSIASGAELQLDGEQSRVSIGSGTTNSGLATLTSIIGTFDMEGDWSTGPGGSSVTTSGALTNTGTLELDVYNADGASRLTIGGALTNSGTVDIGNTALSSATTVTASSLANTGTINLQGDTGSGSTDQATLHISGAAQSTLSGFLRLGGDALLEVGSGFITSVGSGGWLELDGSAARISIGVGTTNSELHNLATNSGTLLLRGNTNLGGGGVTLTTTVGFTNNATTYVDSYAYGDGGSDLTIGGALNNQGTFDIGNSGLGSSTTVTASSLTNAGTLNLQGNTGSGSTDQATLDITSAAPSTVTNFLRISGDALLEFASGGITSVAAGGWFELDGSAARASIGVGTTNSALAGLATNDGTLLLRGNTSLGTGGVTATTDVGFTNNGATYVDSYAYGDGGSDLTIGGALNNQGTFDIGNTGLGSSTTVTASSLTNAGTLNLQGNTGSGSTDEATLDITGAAPSTVANFLRIGGDALLEFASGAITSVAAGGWFELDGSSARASIGVGTTNSALAGLGANDGTLLLRGNTSLGSGGVVLTTKVGFTNIGSIDVDSYGYGDGGSDFTIGGDLLNYGAFSEGNGGISAATSVSATEMINYGTVNLEGSGATATLKVSGPVVNDYGSFTIDSGGLLSVSGEVTNDGSVTINSGGLLSITGTGDSYTQTGGATTIAGGLAGAVNVEGGVVDFTSALTSSSPTGAMTIADGATLEFAAGADSSHTVTFADTTGTLDLGAPGSFATAIKGFADGDVIDLLGTAATSFTYASNVLDVYDNSTLVAALNVGAGYSQSSFSLASDGANGTDILDPKTTSVAARPV